MLPFPRKHLVIALVFFCCAMFTLAKFGPAGNADISRIAESKASAAGATPTVTLTATATATPLNNTIQFSSATYIANEPVPAIITITRTGDLSGSNFVFFSTLNGGTATGGADCTFGIDYITVFEQPVIFGPSDAIKTVNVTICADTLTKGGETVNLGLSGSGTTFGTPSVAVLTINGTTPTPTATFTPMVSSTPTFTPTRTATDTPTATFTSTPMFPTLTPSATPPSFQFSSATYVEDESHTAVITITRTGDTTGFNTVTFSTSDGTATGGAFCLMGIPTGVDYLPRVGLSLGFNPGVTTQTVSIGICGDGIIENDETVNLTLTGANLGSPSTAVLTINDTATAFENQSNIAINGGTIGVPYPSTITVSGGPAVIGSMRVTLYDYATSFPDDTNFLLIGPQGQSMILLADAGGNTPGGPVTLNFSDTAGAVVPDNGPLTTRDFEPTSYGAVANFPAPAPAGPYNEPGSTVGGSGTQTLSGNFGGTDPNGTWNLYVRNQTLIPNAPLAVIGNVAGGWGIEFLGPTAANAAVSGRVMTASGEGIRNATVIITGNSLIAPRVAQTGSFGNFAFEGLVTGETYVVTVNSRRYSFSAPSRVISLVDNVTDADFIADPQE